MTAPGMFLPLVSTGVSQSTGGLAALNITCKNFCSRTKTPCQSIHTRKIFSQNSLTFLITVRVKTYREKPKVLCLQQAHSYLVLRAALCEGIQSALYHKMTCNNVLFISPDIHCKYILFIFKCHSPPVEKCYSASRNTCWPPDGRNSQVLLHPPCGVRVCCSVLPWQRMLSLLWQSDFGPQFASSINNINNVAGYPYDIRTRSLRTVS